MTSLAGPSFWQVAAALVAVLGLLIVAMKFLRQLAPAGGPASARLRRCQRLGPKRELEALEIDGEVFTVYRHDGGLVLLKSEPTEAWEARQPADVSRSTAAVGRQLKAMVAVAGGLTRGRSPR